MNMFDCQMIVVYFAWDGGLVAKNCLCLFLIGLGRNKTRFCLEEKCTVNYVNHMELSRKCKQFN